MFCAVETPSSAMMRLIRTSDEMYIWSGIVFKLNGWVFIFHLLQLGDTLLGLTVLYFIERSYQSFANKQISNRVQNVGPLMTCCSIPSPKWIDLNIPDCLLPCIINDSA